MKLKFLSKFFWIPTAPELSSYSTFTSSGLFRNYVNVSPPLFLAAEGTSALEESWYVTPPACFTQVGPVIVETSPMENLLIEHPSMSVYRATTSHVAPDTPPPTPDAAEELEEPVGILLVPLALMSSTSTLSTSSTSLDSSPDRDRNPDLNEFAHRTAIHDDRPLTSERNENRVRITNQLRSAQKVYQRVVASSFVTSILFMILFSCFIWNVVLCSIESVTREDNLDKVCIIVLMV